MHAWAAIKIRLMKKMFPSPQRSFALIAARSFKSNSTLAALVLAYFQPNDYEIIKRIGQKVLLDDDFPMTPSDKSLVNSTA
jgi:hypothetical protein